MDLRYKALTEIVWSFAAYVGFRVSGHSKVFPNLYAGAFRCARSFSVAYCPGSKRSRVSVRDFGERILKGYGLDRNIGDYSKHFFL